MFFTVISGKVYTEEQLEINHLIKRNKYRVKKTQKM